MYCPKCATPNADGVKFCRSCGTELEALALALSGTNALPDKRSADKAEVKSERDCAELHIKGTRSVAGGASWLIISVLIGVALALFLPKDFDAPWILVWAALFGWMAVVGGVKIGDGIGDILESKSRLRLTNRAARDEGASFAQSDSAPRQLPSHGKPLTIADMTADRRQPSTLGSVTEETTRQLDNQL